MPAKNPILRRVVESAPDAAIRVERLELSNEARAALTTRAASLAAPTPEGARWDADGEPANLAAAAADGYEWLCVLQQSPLPFIDRLDRAQREECRARLGRAVERLAHFLGEPEAAGRPGGTAEAILDPTAGS